jgi:signal transduction histidine kinase
MSALQKWGNEIQSLYPIRCIFECDKPVHIHDVNVATHLYRIAQEAVTNAIRHGKPQNIVIGLKGKAGTGTLSVSDDGTGFEKGEGNRSGMGLGIMNYRADMIGGSLRIQPKSGGGTAVTCVFPLKGLE